MFSFSALQTKEKNPRFFLGSLPFLLSAISQICTSTLSLASTCILLFPRKQIQSQTCFAFAALPCILGIYPVYAFAPCISTKILLQEPTYLNPNSAVQMQRTAIFAVWTRMSGHAWYILFACILHDVPIHAAWLQATIRCIQTRPFALPACYCASSILHHTYPSTSLQSLVGSLCIWRNLRRMLCTDTL